MKNDYDNPKNKAVIAKLKADQKQLIVDYKDTEAAELLAKEGL